MVTPVIPRADWSVTPYVRDTARRTSRCAALGLTACETATLYQPLNPHRGSASGGYSDQQIEANR